MQYPMVDLTPFDEAGVEYEYVDVAEFGAGTMVPASNLAGQLLTQGVPGVLWDPLAPRRRPLGPSPDRESVIGWIGSARALAPGPLTRL